MKKKPTYEELEAIISEYEDRFREFQKAALKDGEREIENARQAVRILKEEAAWRRILVDQSNDGIVVLDAAGRVYEANRRFREMLGYSMEEVQGLHVWDWEMNSSKEDVLEMIKDIDEDGGELETRHRRKDGTFYHVWISSNGAVIDGKKLVFCVCRDITDKKQAERALNDAIDIINKSPVVAFRWRTSKKMPVEFVSENVQQIFEYSSEEIMSGSVNYGDIIYAEDRGRLVEDGAVLKEQPGINEMTHKPYRIVTKTGKIKWVEQTTINNRDDEGNITHIQGIVMDVTRRIEEQKKREKIEMQLSQAKRMEAIGTLAGGVAHDLNNILSGIVSYPELILIDLPEDSPYRKPIETIKKSGEKASVIVQDLLTLARRGVTVSEVVNLNNIVMEQLESPEFNNLKSFHPKVTVELDLADDLYNIKGSPVHLSKTIMNLLSNAAEAMAEGGKICIGTKNRYIDKPVNGYNEIVEGDYITVTVTDNGVGLSKDARERIFEPFYTKKNMGRSGTGLGMPVVWGTVNDHNGYITIDSVEGKGTSFKIYLPATRDEIATAVPSRDIASLKGNGESVLVVDDIEEQREIAEQILTKLGYSVNTVSSGEEAVEAIRKRPSDIILLDMIMAPGIDGLETYKRIIELRPGQKVVIVSGYSETTDVKELQTLGGGKYIKKPYSLVGIGLAIREELQKQ